MGYTLIGDRLDNNGEIINPVRINWQAGAAFVTSICEPWISNLVMRQKAFRTSLEGLSVAACFS